DHFVADAGVRRRLNRVGDQRLGARGDDDVFGVDVEIPELAHRLGDDAAQLGDAWRGRVAVTSTADGFDRGVLNVLRRGEVGLADREHDDVLALALERRDFGEDDERVFGTERAGALGDGGHWIKLGLWTGGRQGSLMADG